MDLPQPPADIELKNIIDKLAQFVARNGPEFEQMTKNKQKDNPKFSFLFGGELFNYYQYKVTTEQAILKIKAAAHDGTGPPSLMQQPFPPPSPPQSTGAPTMTPLQIMNAAAANAASPWLLPQPPQLPALTPSIPLSAINEQQNALQQQITQSEQNLSAQHAALLQSQEALIEEGIRKYKMENLSQRAIESGISISELENILQPIIDSCTKDSISSGKAWILNHNSQGAYHVIAEYLLQKVINSSVPFNQKLHIIYLMNDVIHHCVRKSADSLKAALDNVVVPMFCNSWVSGSSDQQSKLNKLLSLWEAKNNYFAPEIIKKLKNPDNSWLEYKEEMIKFHSNISSPIQLSTNVTYENYRAQHQIFVNHALMQIQTLENQKIQLEQQQQENLIQNLQPPPPPLINTEDRNASFDTPPPNLLPPGGVDYNQPPPPFFSHLPPELVPDFSKPPPGFQTEPVLDDLVPSVPYYQLPAALMVPLIRPDDFNYKSLDPNKLRLPPAIPPNERLVQAVEAFYQRTYAGNSRERLILDADGWEKLGLYEYYRAKNAAKKKKEMEIEAGLRNKSKSPSPIKREKSRSRSPKKKRCYKSKSPSPVNKPRAKSRSRSRTPPPTPPVRHRNSNGRKSPRRPSRRRSKSKSPSPNPPPLMRARSPTPPSFLGSNYAIPFEEQIDETNKGHQMLKKMGWGGSGLGSKEQGIAAPISGGEVRDRVDQYKGVGVNLHDPYENFRKSKGKAFITRMKARAEERSSAS